MGQWVDVRPSDWFYKELTEASNYILADGEPLAKGIPYNTFDEGKEYVYKEELAVEGQTEFDLGVSVVPTYDNPLFVYMDGKQVVYKELVQGASTTVKLHSGVRDGALMSFRSAGVPTVDTHGKPSSDGVATYPVITLECGDSYYYDMFTAGFSELLTVYGSHMKRAQVSQSDADSLGIQQIGAKYIGYSTDVYWVSTNGELIMPYKYNNMTVNLTHAFWEAGNLKKKTVSVTPVSASVLHTDRFFPNAKITRAEAFTLINRVRRSLYARYSEIDAPDRNLDFTEVAREGQSEFRLDDYFSKADGMVTKDDFYVHSDDYEVIDDCIIKLKQSCVGGEVIKVTSAFAGSQFPDVANDDYGMFDTANIQTFLFNGGSESWWAPHVVELEIEKLADGTPMIQGMSVTSRFSDTIVNVNTDYNPATGTDEEQIWFMPLSFMTRAQTVTMLNRFLTLCTERFL